MGRLKDMIGDAEAEAQSAAARALQARELMEVSRVRETLLQSELETAAQKGTPAEVRQLTDDLDRVRAAMMKAAYDLTQYEAVAEAAYRRYAQVRQDLRRPLSARQPTPTQDRKTVVMEPGDAWAKLREALITARLEADNPHLTDLADAVGCSRSKLSRIFGGQTRPDTTTLTALAEVLGVETRAFQTMWIPLWQAMMRDTATTRPTSVLPRTASPREPRTPSEGHGCSVCGSWVIDANRHLEWHMSMQNGSVKGTPSSHRADAGLSTTVGSMNQHLQRRTAG